MVDKTKRLTLIRMSIFMATILVVAAACSGSSEEGDEDAGQAGDSAGGSGGEDPGVQNTGGSSGDDAGTNTNTGTGEDGGGGQVLDADTKDKTVEVGGTCSLTADMGAMATMPGMEGMDMSSTGMSGKCINPSDPCEGGTAEEASQMGLPVQIDPGGDCLPGLLCCIDTDQCKKMDGTMKEGVKTMMDSPSFLDPNQTNAQLAESWGFPLSEDMMSMSCTETDSCTGLMNFQIGCPSGQTCCMVTSFDDIMRGLFGDGGFTMPDGGFTVPAGG